MVHYIDSPAEFEQAMGGAYGDYVRDLKREGTIGSVGMSTHNPITGKMAVESGDVDMLLFSVNPAYDMKPASEDIETLFGDYGDEANAMDPDRMELYRMAEASDIGPHRHEVLWRLAPARPRALSFWRGSHACAVHSLCAHATGGGERPFGLSQPRRP